MLKRFFQQAAGASLEQLPDLSGILEKQYQEQATRKNIQFDDAQFMALKPLQSILEKLLAAVDYDLKSAAYKLISNQPEKCRSLYIFGGVGRGKTMLMDLFYEACPLIQKRRVHFNAFMLEVHAFMHQWRQQNNTDAISALAKKIRGSALLLCFDEFHVTDIADAMILGRLFSSLFALGTTVVITSNRHPEDLYPGGLQRELFLPFIKLLQERSEIIELVAKEDYRLSRLQALKTTYYCPLDENAAEFVQQSFNYFTNFAPRQPGNLKVWGRNLILEAVHGDILFTSFDQLCEQPLGSADYLEIAREFSTLILAEIPRLKAEKHNEAKRFATLIDALYEHKVKLICSAAVPAHKIYTQGEGAFEFERTVSRLIEMQSENYLHTEHIGRS
ncbi:AFG1 family ATPase [Candidatus Methylobacter favarea]|uniref:AFG1 family ATPase n=1 Tax=Candidatus Methylobacter favarea TaxID=2707345 RepID=A0A8S0X7A3_9GAMM|nr:cell division protein ZapE [Candidatus Methylobacter favarea]CAA9889885.1 AFG1 family ATPase [Candidatus Methylobacter favarea]